LSLVILDTLAFIFTNPERLFFLTNLSRQYKKVKYGMFSSLQNELMLLPLAFQRSIISRRSLVFSDFINHYWIIVNIKLIFHFHDALNFIFSCVWWLPGVTRSAGYLFYIIYNNSLFEKPQSSQRTQRKAATLCGLFRLISILLNRKSTIYIEKIGKILNIRKMLLLNI